MLKMRPKKLESIETWRCDIKFTLNIETVVENRENKINKIICED